MKHLIALSVICAPVLATPLLAECPQDPSVSEALVGIVDDMRDAPDQGTAQRLSGQMWDIWLKAPDAKAQFMLDEGLTQLRYGDYAASRTALSELIAYCPAYAEGYNQRAYAAFLSGDYAAALIDLDVAIDLQPVHLGALTGKARTLIELGENDAAQIALRRALDINPWLGERALLDGTLESDI